MDKELNPVTNFTEGSVKQLFSMELLETIGVGEFKLKQGFVLEDKRKKKNQTT